MSQGETIQLTVTMNGHAAVRNAQTVLALAPGPDVSFIFDARNPDDQTHIVFFDVYGPVRVRVSSGAESNHVFVQALEDATNSLIGERYAAQTMHQLIGAMDEIFSKVPKLEAVIGGEIHGPGH